MTQIWQGFVSVYDTDGTEIRCEIVEDLLLEKAQVLPGAGKFGTFRVESVDLMQSELDRSGAKYSCLAGVNLFP